MIGMQAVASQVDDLVSAGIYDRMREQQGLPVENDTKHMIFSGPPGVGKTEIARTIGPLYKALGLVPGTEGRAKNDFVDAKRADLVGQYQGETEQKVLALFNQARGGVLFIDEAYSLIDGDQDMYGKTAVTLLMDLMEQHRDDTVVILAGYPKEMGKFLNSNPGLRSRFTTTINFPPYKNSDLYKIAGVFFNKGDYKLEKGAADALKAGIAEFGDGNARNVRNMVQKIRQAHKTRTAFDPESDLTRITTEDAQIGMERYRAALPPEEPKEPSSPRTKRVKA